MTNATKAGLITAINAVMSLAIAFGVSLSDTQLAAVMTTVNALLALYVGLTYKDSPKRIEE
jgi:hypothetical protein